MLKVLTRVLLSFAYMVRIRSYYLVYCISAFVINFHIVSIFQMNSI